LKGVRANRRRRHLTGDDDEGRRVHVRVANRRDDVGGPGTARDHGDAGLTGSQRVALGHVTGPLLVTYEDVANGGVQDRVVHGQNGPTGQAEDRVDALLLEALDECLHSGELHDAPSLLNKQKASLIWEASGVRVRVTTGAERLLLPESRYAWPRL